MTGRVQARVRAPELRGRGGWIGTDGDLSLEALRGKVVLLDFWTGCCVNCLHVLDELRPLEQAFADVLVVVGVHSPKFEHERDHATVVAAVDRYEVHHPVLDDPDLETWKQYAVRAWPTLVVVDPEGYVVHTASGEGHGASLHQVVAEVVAEHEARGTLRRGSGPWVPPAAVPGDLRFPGGVTALPGGSLLVSSTGGHQLVELDGDRVVRRIGTGERGLADGGPDDARFSEPGGSCLLPDDVAAEVGYDLVVADTVNHALRGVRLADGSVRTVAGTGEQWMQGDGTERMSSPWDVAWYRDRVVVAMAGVHQLWSFDPRSGAVEVLAGTTNEGLVDGELAAAWFAQTSGLVADGDDLWVVDSETSSLRLVRNGTVRSVVGKGLFDFGHVDGPLDGALLQHPLGACLLPDGSVAVADTYNGAVRRVDVDAGEVTTLATGLAEPTACVMDGELLAVVESAAHRVVRLRLPEEATRVRGQALRTQRPATDVGSGSVGLQVVFEPPPGQVLDERYGPATWLVVSASPPSLLASGAGSGSDLTRPLELAEGEGVLHVSVRAASCDKGAEHPACHVHQQDWGVPVRVASGGPDRLELVLRG